MTPIEIVRKRQIEFAQSRLIYLNAFLEGKVVEYLHFGEWVELIEVRPIFDRLYTLRIQ